MSVSRQSLIRYANEIDRLVTLDCPRARLLTRLVCEPEQQVLLTYGTETGKVSVELFVAWDGLRTGHVTEECKGWTLSHPVETRNVSAKLASTVAGIIERRF